MADRRTKKMPKVSSGAVAGSSTGTAGSSRDPGRAASMQQTRPAFVNLYRDLAGQGQDEGHQQSANVTGPARSSAGRESVRHQSARGYPDPSTMEAGQGQDKGRQLSAYGTGPQRPPMERGDVRQPRTRGYLDLPMTEAERDTHEGRPRPAWLPRPQDPPVRAGNERQTGPSYSSNTENPGGTAEATGGFASLTHGRDSVLPGPTATPPPTYSSSRPAITGNTEGDGDQEHRGTRRKVPSSSSPKPQDSNIDEARWSKDDEKVIKDMRKRIRNGRVLGWNDIAQRLPGRTPRDVETYHGLYLNDDPNAIVRFTPEEDAIALEEGRQAQSWQDMQKKLPRRTAIQIQQHWRVLSKRYPDAAQERTMNLQKAKDKAKAEAAAQKATAKDEKAREKEQQLAEKERRLAEKEQRRIEKDQDKKYHEEQLQTAGEQNRDIHRREVRRQQEIEQAERSTRRGGGKRRGSGGGSGGDSGEGGSRGSGGVSSGAKGGGRR